MALLDSKFQPWLNVREQLEHILRTTDPEEHCVMVPYGLQLAQTFHHRHVIRCMTFYHCTNSNIYVTQVDTGVINEVYFWCVSTLPDEEVKCQRIKINTLMSRIIFVPQHRVFVGYSPDVTLHVFSDLNNNCMELTQSHCSETILCMVYNEDMDELVTGGRGFLQAWKMTHVEIRDPLVRGRPIESEITEDDWVRDVRVDRKRHQLFALCDEGIHIINYITNKEVYCIKNWHASALTCFVFYRKLEYCITASMDGAIKVWNAVVFKEVHQFIGHYASVTGLVIHPADPLLISSSKDGTLRIWRLDTFELTHRLNVGEKVLGMKLANSNQLYYYTLHDIKVWNFNLFHHLFTPVRSCVHKLARITSPSSPSRILCAAEDGGVRLISAVSGTELTIIYPMPSYQVLTDIVYDPKNSLIFTVLEMGDVLIFDSSTNPCQAKELLVPMMPEESVISLALVKLDCANGCEETPTSDYLIFAGLASGQISLIECQSHSMKYPLKAHGGGVLALECSHGVYGPEVDNYIASADRLISCGSDKLVKIWEIGIGNTLQAIKLSCLKVIACTTSPSHLSMLGNILCTVLPTYVVNMYELSCDNDGESFSSLNIPTSQLPQYISANKIPGIRPLKHLKDHDHTKQITALCSCPSLGLFATTSDDGALKIWDVTNTLVRELWFDDTLRSVCFANARGDLLVGFQNHISHVSISSYLPLSFMELLVEREFEDERVEEPFQFNPDLPLWFNLKTILTFPTDLLMRQHVRKKLPQLRKQILGEAASQIEEKGKAKEDAQSSIEILVDAESIFKVIEESAIQLAEKRVSVERKKTEPTQPKKIKSRQIDGSLSFHGNGDQAPPISISDESSKIGKSLKQAKMDVPQQTIKDDKIKAKESKVDHDVAMEISEEKDMEEGEKIEEISSKGEPTDEMVDEMMEGLVEEPKIKLPIAPDGYIPNSVIRQIVQPPPPPPPLSPSKEWKIKDVPEGRVHFVEGDQSDVEYEDHEPFTWASSEESSRHEVTPVTSPSPPTEQALYQPFKPGIRTDAETEETTGASKDKRRLSLKVVGKLVLSHPGFSEDRGKTVSAKKTKRIGRGINKEAGSLKKYKRRGTLAGISQDEEEFEEAEEDECEKDPVDLLLQKINDYYWYPKGLKMDVYTTVKTLLTLLEESSSDHYQTICDLLLELNGLVNFGGPLLDSLVRRYVRDLKSSNNDRRRSAIHTLRGLGDKRPAVILGILNAMADNESSIQKEAAEALANLAGISSKNAMEDYLANIGIMQLQTMDPLDDLARRFRREARQGETRLHTAATHLLERRQSSQSHFPSSYSPERVEDWLRTYLGDKDLYQYKPKGLKIQAPIHKKKRRMSLTHRVHRPTATGEIIALAEEELSDEALSGYESEEGDEEEEEEKDEEKDESIEDEWEEKLVEMESFARHPEEELLSKPVKLNKHQAMMKAKEMAAEREKAIMEKKAKEKMRKHMEEYEEAMKKKRQKLKHLLPYHAQYYKYYSKPQNVGGKVYQGARRDIKAILKSQSSVQRTETTTSIVAERSSHDSRISVGVQEEASYQSVVSETEQTSFQTNLRQMVHLPIEEEEEEVTTPEQSLRSQSLRKPVIQPISREKSKKEIEKRSFGKGIHFYKDRRRLEDDEMIAKGWGTPFRPRFNTPVEPTGDSGLGESLLTGTGTGTSDTFSESVIGTKTGGSGGIKSRQDESSRPKSNLTMANVRRHELLSAHKDDRDSQIVPKENWRDFFHLPMIKDKRRHHDLLQELQRGNRRVYEKIPTKPTNIKYVPSGVPLTPGISNQRVLHDITVGSKGKGQGIGGRGDILEGPSLGKRGITGYGALQMTWSNMVPQYSAQQRQEGHCVTMGTRKHDLSLGASERKREEWKKYDVDTKIWLRTQMLYPSLFALQEIDFIKRRLSEPHPNKKGNLFQWETPLPMVSFEPTEKETEKPKRPCRLCDQEDRHKFGPSLPSIIQSENGEDVPIVPRNSIASTCDPWTLPRIKIHKKHAMDGVMTGQQPLKEISTES
ncbi:uncharacterized protein LOC121428578 [Lytechinus variegatus]|uniref:uncharacterized protein LOC121428578 n=1 Tax=Lytechinus variegatus TaxID=7654 RepID=UPI001BB2949F|nr:uncharacterized protein LOC121428578 [Lytechinus variegatus]